MKISFKTLLLAAPGAFLIGCGPAKKPAVPQSSAESSPSPAAATAPADATVASADSAPNGGGGGGNGGPRQRGGGGGGGWNRGGNGGGGGGGGADRGAERLQRMATALNLTPDQSEKIKAIMEAQRPAADAIRNDTTLSREDRRAKMMELRKTTEPQIDAILTPEQKTKWDAERAQMGNRQGGGGGGNGGGGNGGGNPPPPPGN